MWERILNRFGIHAHLWKLGGYDTFSGESYPIEGVYFSESAARRAADHELERLERLQPSGQSGGQADDGIQDRIFIIRPDGTRYRYLPQDKIF